MMSTDAAVESKMEVEVEEVVDEFVASFESLENSDLLAAKVEDYVELLKNPRVDEQAVKVKEQCIYK